MHKVIWDKHDGRRKVEVSWTRVCTREPTGVCGLPRRRMVDKNLKKLPKCPRVEYFIKGDRGGAICGLWIQDISELDEILFSRPSTKKW